MIDVYATDEETAAWLKELSEDAGNVRLPAGLAERVLEAAAPKRNRRLGAVLVSALIAAASVVAFVVAPTVSVDGQPPSAQASAADFFLSAADEQAAAAPRWANAKWWKVTTQVTNADGAVVNLGTVWSPRSKTGWLLSRQDGYPLDKQRGYNALVFEARKLSADPAELRAFLTQWSGGQTGRGQLGEITQLLTMPTRPATRAALLRIAATLPRVVNGGGTVDNLNRPATSIDVPDCDSRLPVGTLTCRYLFAEDGTFLETQIISASGEPALAADPSGVARPIPESYGRNADGSRPAISPGGVINRITIVEAQPTNERPT